MMGRLIRKRPKSPLVYLPPAMLPGMPILIKFKVAGLQKKKWGFFAKASPSSYFAVISIINILHTKQQHHAGETT